MYKKPFIIAEAGCNHMGQMEIAHDLIETAAHFCKADAIKFQKRCPKELLTEEQYNAPHPNPANSYGETYGAHREFLEFTFGIAHIFALLPRQTGNSLGSSRNLPDSAL